MTRKIIKKPELLSPAGDWPSLLSALKSGCDSVYFGVKGFNMRHLASNFDVLELKKIMKQIHGHECRGYLALNVIVYENELSKVKSILKSAQLAGVDGVICWDMSVVGEALALGLNVHLSTQASVSNYQALKKYYELGIKRVVLARETRLLDIKAIVKKAKKEGLNCEIETFIHGAMCVSVSGRCFLSEYTFSKSANRGACLQPCRREYRIIDVDGECEYDLGSDYLLSPKDLCTIEFIDKLIDSKIDSFKIEGRIRSPEYVGVVTSVYRRAIDAYFAKKLKPSLIKNLKAELSAVYNRGFSDGFYFGRPKDSTARELEHTHEKVYVGEVIKFFKKINVAEIQAHNHSLSKGDDILCFGKNTSASFAKVDNMQINHEFVKKIDKGQTAGVKLPFVVKRKDKIFIWRRKVSS
jgi:U32 family peptidase